MGDVNISGAKVLINIPALGGPVLTETIVSMWICMAVIGFLCWFLTRDLKVHATSKRQIIAEYLVKAVNNMVSQNMGPQWLGFAPFIATLISLSAVCSLSSLVLLFSPTQDLSTLLGWALVVFVIITYYKIKANGIGGYAKGYLQPIPVMLPLNIISEIATPISMAFRHFGNIASGTVISTLVYGALAAASHALFSLLPGMLGSIFGNMQLLQVGIPAVLSLYFDLFSSCIQAYIFCMLTMMYTAAAAQAD